VTFRIEKRRSGDTLTVRLIGGLGNEHLREVRAQVCDAPCPVVIDLGELTLISVEGVRFLNACEEDGMPIVNVSGYIAEWMTLEGRSKRKRP
jgi:hypothetical protein